MNSTKTIFLPFLLLLHIPHTIKSDFKTDASKYCQNLWQGTKDVACKAYSSITPSRKTDPRVMYISTAGLLIACLGFWMMIRGVNTFNADNVKFLQKKLGNKSDATTKGLITTAFGVLCALTGVTLIATSKPIINHLS